MSDALPGASRETPVFMKLVRDDDGIKWANIVIMLGVTVLSGYLAAKSQRWGAKPDLTSLVKMRIAAAGEKLGNEITKIGVSLSIASARAYDKARPV